jgi:signal transduction histidine kinase
MPPAGKTRGAEPMRHRHTILVVDDEPDLVQSLQGLLRLEYHVLGATSGREALELLRKHEVHVILSDQRMPGMTGVELLQQARAEYPDAVRLLFTGYADIRAVIDAINQGSVYRYLTKPWDPGELETILRQAAEQYELRVERRRLLAELQAKNRELAEANELKEAFIRVASHELRTPLNLLLALSWLALRDTGPDQPVRRWVGGMVKASQRLAVQVNQLTQMLAARQFERPLRREPTDLARLLREAADEVRPFVELRHQDLTLDLAPDLGTLDVEPRKIGDCVGHLLLNAIKFTPDGGTIRLAARRTAKGGAEVQVSDSGVGIDALSLPHVFEPFFTAFDVSRHSSGHFEFGGRGLGLGLSLVKAFVEMHGGAVSATSEPGRGSTFTLTLPPDRAA